QRMSSGDLGGSVLSLPRTLGAEASRDFSRSTLVDRHANQVPEFVTHLPKTIPAPNNERSIFGVVLRWRRGRTHVSTEMRVVEFDHDSSPSVANDNNIY